VQDLTKGPIAGNVVRMASFMLVSMVFQTLYFLVDLYFVGRLGRAAVAAVSVSGNLNFLVLAASQMLGVGTTALIAHATGRKDRAEVRLIFNQAHGLALIVGALFFATLMSLRHRYAEGQAADAETAHLAVAYLSWFIPAVSLQFPLVAMTAALRGIGNFKPGMLVQSGTVLLNILLAPVLIFGWGTGHPLGVAGAAIATMIAVVVAVVALVIYLVRAESYLAYALAEWKPRLALWTRMLKIGLPAGAEFALMGVYLFLVYAITRPFGAAAQAGFGIGLRVVQAGFLPVVALGFSVSPVAGQNYGARLPERVRETFRVGALMATVLMVVFTIACQIFPDAMVRVFSHDPGVIAVGGQYLRIVSFNYVASGLIFVTSSMFQALGNTMPALVTSSVRLVMLAIPALWMARQPGFDLKWIWYLSVGSVWCQMVLNALLLQAQFRKRLAFAPVAATGSG
jgi:putative MATE family efflux protein